MHSSLSLFIFSFLQSEMGRDKIGLFYSKKYDLFSPDLPPFRNSLPCELSPDRQDSPSWFFLLPLRGGRHLPFPLGLTVDQFFAQSHPFTSTLPTLATHPLVYSRTLLPFFYQLVMVSFSPSRLYFPVSPPSFQPFWRSVLCLDPPRLTSVSMNRTSMLLGVPCPGAKLPPRIP